MRSIDALLLTYELESARVWDNDSQLQDDWGNASSVAPTANPKVSLFDLIERSSYRSFLGFLQLQLANNTIRRSESFEVTGRGRGIKDSECLFRHGSLTGNQTS